MLRNGEDNFFFKEYDSKVMDEKNYACHLFFMHPCTGSFWGKNRPCHRAKLAMIDLGSPTATTMKIE